MLGDLGTEVVGLFQVLCSDGLCLFVLFSVVLVFMFRLLLGTVKRTVPYSKLDVYLIYKKGESASSSVES